MSAAETRLAVSGTHLPLPVAPVANYVTAVQTGSLLFVSGQICLDANGSIGAAHRGKVGAAVSQAQGQDAARLCALNVLAQAKQALGNLDRIVRCVRLCGYVNAEPTFGALPQVMNGASDLMVEALGDAGRHARTTIGVAQLPLDAAVEVDAVFEIR